MARQHTDGRTFFENIMNGEKLWKRPKKDEAAIDWTWHPEGDQSQKDGKTKGAEASLSQGIVRQGWMERDEGMLMSSRFQRRWAVLGTNHNMSFYKTQQRLNPINPSISLVNVTNINTEKPVDVPKGRAYHYKLKVECTSGKHEFRCGTTEELSAWEDAISGKVRGLANTKALATLWGAQFGTPVNQIACTKLPMYNAPIPDVLRRMKSYLYDNGGVKSEGIFRLAPNKSEFDQVKHKLNANTFERCEDINMMARGIKGGMKTFQKVYGRNCP